MPQARNDSYTFVFSPAEFTPIGLSAQQTNGLCVYLLRFLADSIHHTSIKVYLSAVRALHIEQGLPDPLVGCLRLQHVVRGIKPSQASTNRQRLPVTDDIMRVIFQSLDTSRPDHCMFWAASTFAFFRFPALCHVHGTYVD